MNQKKFLLIAAVILIGIVATSIVEAQSADAPDPSPIKVGSKASTGVKKSLFSADDGDHSIKLQADGRAERWKPKQSLVNKGKIEVSSPRPILSDVTKSVSQGRNYDRNAYTIKLGKEPTSAKLGYFNINRSPNAKCGGTRNTRC